MPTISENLRAIHRRIAAAAERSGRPAREINLLAVTKTRPAGQVLEAIEAGVRIIGENRVQEALAKHPSIGEKVRWHLIGHLQKNKVKKALSIFEMIHSLDSLELAQEIERHAAGCSRVIDVLLQVNVSGEASKFGIAPPQAYQVVTRILQLPHLNLCGLMTIPPLSEDPEHSRPHFRALAALKEELNHKLGQERLVHLSMGMSNDFEVAIEEGADFIRVGSAIFATSSKKG